MSSKYNLIAVVGPTASGKTAFAAHLAQRIDGEVISADSRQVYRNMNLGTGKDYADFLVGGTEVPVYLIDLVEPGYKYSIYEYQRDFIAAYNQIRSRGKQAILCGGSGMYIDAVTRKYRLDEVPFNTALRKELEGKSSEELAAILSTYKTLHNKTDIDTPEHAHRAIEIEVHYQHHPPNPVLTDLRPLFIGIMYNRETERQRITDRLHQRLQQGMIDEVQQLLNTGLSPESLTYYGLEYRYITLFLQQQLPYDQMVALLNTAIHQFAKRQRTWFRKMEREGCSIHWIEGECSMESKLQQAEALLNNPD